MIGETCYREIREVKSIVDSVGVNFTEVKVTRWIGDAVCQTIECWKDNISQFKDGLMWLSDDKSSLSAESNAQFESAWEANWMPTKEENPKTPT